MYFQCAHNKSHKLYNVQFNIRTHTHEEMLLSSIFNALFVVSGAQGRAQYARSRRNPLSIKSIIKKYFRKNHFPRPKK